MLIERRLFGEKLEQELIQLPTLPECFQMVSNNERNHLHWKIMTHCIISIIGIGFRFVSNLMQCGNVLLLF